jgi:hypothetical protein
MGDGEGAEDAPSPWTRHQVEVSWAGDPSESPGVGFRVGAAEGGTWGRGIQGPVSMNPWVGRTQPQVAPFEEYHQLDLPHRMSPPSRPPLIALAGASECLRRAPSAVLVWRSRHDLGPGRPGPGLRGVQRAPWCGHVNTATPSSLALSLTFRVQIELACPPVLRTTNRLRSVRTTLPWD